MKLYDELKAEMEAIKQQMVEAEKSECTVALKKVKELCKELVLQLACLRVHLLKDEKIYE